MGLLAFLKTNIKDTYKKHKQLLGQCENRMQTRWAFGMIQQDCSYGVLGATCLAAGGEYWISAKFPQIAACNLLRPKVNWQAKAWRSAEVE